MDTVHSSCAGLDVHKRTVMTCVRRRAAGGRLRKETREFGTTTRDLLALSDWMAARGVTHVAMESTGVFWKPIFNILESRFEVLLCNAKHIKQVPGRKTDVKDCEWIAELLEHGLLKASFVPPRPQRELRDLTRHRAQLVGDKTRVANRIQKTLEDANIKLGSVATDVLGLSGRDMIDALIEGQNDPKALAHMARGRLRKKIPELKLAMEGRVTEHHRFMLETLRNQLGSIEKLIARMEKQIDKAMQQVDSDCGESTEGPAFQECLALLIPIPGLERVSASSILAEVGTDMSHFPSDAHLSSWAGICPGNNESAGKRRSGKTTKGNRWLKRTLVQCAWGAARSKDSYFSALYRRIARKRGAKRAAVAVAHALLVVVYHVLKNRRHYVDLGRDYFDRLDPDRQTRYHLKRLQALGHRVQLTPEEDAA